MRRGRSGWDSRFRFSTNADARRLPAESLSWQRGRPEPLSRHKKHKTLPRSSGQRYDVRVSTVCYATTERVIPGMLSFMPPPPSWTAHMPPSCDAYPAAPSDRTAERDASSLCCPTSPGPTAATDVRRQSAAASHAQSDHATKLAPQAPATLRSHLRAKRGTAIFARSTDASAPDVAIPA